MPKREHHYWVYILSNRSHTLYIGLTNNLRARVTQHREQTLGTHTAKYKINRLVYFEHYQYVSNAITREKELKHWTERKRSPLSSPSTQPGKNLCPTKLQSPPQPKTQIPFGNDKQSSAAAKDSAVPFTLLVANLCSRLCFSCCHSQRESAFCPKRHNRFHYV